ncbi:hypothetical protein [Nannocystis pusilla]|uniref:hypothetical protein n=1 Tax=Nannocystis pusilla TaxID=889268 RepID=UPI003B7C641D
MVPVVGTVSVGSGMVVIEPVVSVPEDVSVSVSVPDSVVVTEPLGHALKSTTGAALRK